MPFFIKKFYILINFTLIIMADKNPSPGGEQTIIVKEPETDFWSSIVKAFGKFLKFLIPFLIIIILFFYFYYNWGVYGTYWDEYVVVTYNDLENQAYSFIFDRFSGFETMWGTEKAPDAEDLGIIFEGFSTVTPVIPSGDEAVFIYDFSVSDDVGETGEVPLELICLSEQEEFYEQDKTITSSSDGDVMVSAMNPGSYLNNKCTIKTTKINKDEVLKVKGSARFTYSTEDVTLDVYFLKGDLYRTQGKDFFDIYNIDEKLPIKSKYNGEPVAIGIGTSLQEGKQYQQPVSTDSEYAYIALTLRNEWNGFVSRLEGVEFYLPLGVELHEEEKGDNLICPFKGGDEDKRGYNKYAADENILEKIDKFGHEQEMNFVSFFCRIEMEDSTLLRDSPHTKKQYIASAEYVYEFSPKAANVKLMGEEKKVEDGTSGGGGN